MGYHGRIGSSISPKANWYNLTKLLNTFRDNSRPYLSAQVHVPTTKEIISNKILLPGQRREDSFPHPSSTLALTQTHTLSLCLSVCPCLSLSVFLPLSISVSLSVSLSLTLSVFLSLTLSLSLPLLLLMTRSIGSYTGRCSECKKAGILFHCLLRVPLPGPLTQHSQMPSEIQQSLTQAI